MNKKILIPYLKLNCGETLAPFKGFYIGPEEVDNEGRTHLHLASDKAGNLIRLNMVEDCSNGQKVEIGDRIENYKIYEAHYLYLEKIKVNPTNGHHFFPEPCPCDDCRTYNLLYGK